MYSSIPIQASLVVVNQFLGGPDIFFFWPELGPSQISHSFAIVFVDVGWEKTNIES
jgi:hypothetical protein